MVNPSRRDLLHPFQDTVIRWLKSFRLILKQSPVYTGNSTNNYQYLILWML